jgi:hypothetical protein
MDTPGPWFMSLSTADKVMFASGYILALNSVSDTLTAMLETLEPPKTKAEDFGLYVPEFLREGMEQFWDFRGIDFPKVVALTQAIYTEPQNAQVPLAEVFPIARDLSLHRITDEDARRRLAELRSEAR